MKAHTLRHTFIRESRSDTRNMTCVCVFVYRRKLCLILACSTSFVNCVWMWAQTLCGSATIFMRYICIEWGVILHVMTNFKKCSARLMSLVQSCSYLRLSSVSTAFHIYPHSVDRKQCLCCCSHRCKVSKIWAKSLWLLPLVFLNWLSKVDLVGWKKKKKEIAVKSTCPPSNGRKENTIEASNSNF